VLVLRRTRDGPGQREGRQGPHAVGHSTVSHVRGEWQAVSYARFGWEGSDVYVFSHVSGGIQCCGCRLNESAMGPDDVFPPSWTTPTGTPFDREHPGAGQPRAAYDEMIAHLGEHLRAGHTVPTDTIPCLAAARDEVTGDGS
jgi:hypothetical protein